MNPVERLKDFEEQLDKLEQRFEAGGNLGEEFKKSIDDLGDSIAKSKKDVDDLKNSMSGGMCNAIDGLIFQGEHLSDAVRHIGSSVAKTAYNNTVNPVAQHLGGPITTLHIVKRYGILARVACGRFRPVICDGRKLRKDVRLRGSGVGALMRIHGRASTFHLGKRASFTAFACCVTGRR